MSLSKKSILVLQEIIEKKIYFIRGKKVMLDKDLSELYGVTTGNLNKAVKRNIDRFPEDFMFQLSKEEFDSLIFQIGTSKRGGTRKLPYVFTQEGVAMLSGILNSSRAVQVNIQIMRVFVKLKELMSGNAGINRKIAALEKKYEQHDQEIKLVFNFLNQLFGNIDASSHKKSKKKIGYK